MVDLDPPAAVALDGAVRVDFGPADRAVVDGTAGRLDLPASSLDVVSLTLVDLPHSPVEVARRAGLVESGGFLHGARWGILEPREGRWRVDILTSWETDPSQSRVPVGGLSARDVERWAQLLDGRRVRVVVFVEATPGLAGVEARFCRSLLESHDERTASAPTRAELDATPPPIAPAQWYADPADEAQLRYWDGAAWTTHTAPR